MIFSNLTNKLSLTLLAMLLLLSASFISYTLYMTPMFLQEVNQQLNRDLADNIVSEKNLLNDGKVNHEALQSVFMGLMLVNPLIEVYLLDPQGKILAYSAPEQSVKLAHVEMKPVKAFIDSRHQQAITGNDPRHPGTNKIFSAAPVYSQGKLQGYLYIVLGGETYDSMVHMSSQSQMLQLWLVAIIVSLVITAIFGILWFRHLTRRIRLLSRGLQDFKQHDFQHACNLQVRKECKFCDEIDVLGDSFNQMSTRIVEQLQQLQQSDQSRREMLENVSHDLRTPLASLQGYLETLLLKMDTLSHSDKQAYIRIAFQQSERLKQLITELFELATLDNRHMQLSIESFSMSELLQDVIQKFQLKAGQKGLKITSLIPPRTACVYGDIGLIQRVIENLLDNAIKYTPAGGQVHITLSPQQDKVITAISDTGQGIPADDLPYIFERFYRVDKHRYADGTGLGLAIAQRIMLLHHSTIQVDSHPQKGSRFCFYLPASQPQLQQGVS